MDEEDIKDKLQSQGVTKVERMKGRKNGQLVPSDSYILTINSPNIPPQIKVGFLICNKKVYFPNPQRCFNCQKYGHNKIFCRNEPKCAKCGQAGHDDHECENEAKCANCNGDHPACVRSCPKWEIEKEVIKVKYQNNIPFHEARQQVEGPVTDPSKNSYPTVPKSYQWTSNIKAPNTFKTEEWLTHTIDSLLKRFDAIKAQKSKQTIHQFCLSIMWNNLACACLWTHKWIKKVKFSICNAIKRSTWCICCSKWWKWNGIRYNNPEKSYPWG